MRPMRFLLVPGCGAAARARLRAGRQGGGGTGVLLDDPVEGDYFFVDKISFDKIKSLASVDQKVGEICVNGHRDVHRHDDHAESPRRDRVHLARHIEKQGPGKVDGLFTVGRSSRSPSANAPENHPAEIIFDQHASSTPPASSTAKLRQGRPGPGQGPGRRGRRAHRPDQGGPRLRPRAGSSRWKGKVVAEDSPRLDRVRARQEEEHQDQGHRRATCRSTTRASAWTRSGSGLDFPMLSCDPDRRRRRSSQPGVRQRSQAPRSRPMRSWKRWISSR